MLLSTSFLSSDNIFWKTLVRWRHKSVSIARAGQLLMDSDSAGLLHRCNRCYLSSPASCQPGRHIPMLMGGTSAEFHVNRVMLIDRELSNWWFLLQKPTHQESLSPCHEDWVSLFSFYVPVLIICFSSEILVTAFSFSSIPSILLFSNMLLDTPAATLWNAAVSSQEVGRCLLALPTWEGGMGKTSKGGVWFWGRLQSATSGMGANLFPWAALNQTEVAKSVLEMCHGLLRCLELGVWSASCSQPWDELRACAFSELKFERVSKQAGDMGQQIWCRPWT